MNLIGGSSFKIGSGGVFGVDANGQVIVVGSRVELNGPAESAPTDADNAENTPLLNIFTLPKQRVK